MNKQDRIAIVVSAIYSLIPLLVLIDGIRDGHAGVIAFLVPLIAYWGYRFIKGDISFLEGSGDLKRTGEASFYDAAALEINAGARRPGLWAKAMVEADGEERAVTASYIKLLVVALKDEASAAARSPRFTPEQIELMQSFAIIHNGKYFERGEMHFDKFDDAIEFSRNQRREP